MGALESEAVITYTRCLQELESGRLPEWSHLEAPQISKDYWRLPEDALLIDVIRAVRADEVSFSANLKLLEASVHFDLSQTQAD